MFKNAPERIWTPNLRFRRPTLYPIELQAQQLLLLRNLQLNRKKKTEEEGFEPPVPCGTMVFKTIAISHSATPPSGKRDNLTFSALNCKHFKLAEIAENSYFITLYH